MLWWTSYGGFRGWESGSRKVDDLDSALPKTRDEWTLVYLQ